MITIGTAYLGIDFPLVLGFWAILAETVPVVGPLMGAVPAIFIAYGQEPSMAFSCSCFLCCLLSAGCQLYFAENHG